MQVTGRPEGKVTNVNPTLRYGMAVTVLCGAQHSTTFQIHLETFDTIGEVKEKVLEKTGIPTARQHLFIEKEKMGKVNVDEITRTVSSYKITSTIPLVLECPDDPSLLERLPYQQFMEVRRLPRHPA